MADRASPGADLLRRWRALSRWPGGGWLFGRLIGHTVPYSGTMRATVRQLEPGHARLELRERRRVRNHLGSIHAVALVNLGELTTGLATLTALSQARGIPRRIGVDFLKKARGRIEAEARVAFPGAIDGPVDQDVTAELRDASGDVVARVVVTWRLGPSVSG